MKKKKTVAIAASLSILIGILSASATGLKSSTMAPQLHIRRYGNYTYQTGVTGYTPAQIKMAYGINNVSQNGSGQTIAIIDAYGSPNIQSDLNTFDKQFNLPQAQLSIATSGRSIGYDTSWALETSMDVEWAHALAPNAKILLVEARSASTNDLLSAINYTNQSGAQVVSMSWGGAEWSTENTYDSAIFSHPGTVYVAAAGDSGLGAEWPAASKNVLAVGGTTLQLNSNGTRVSETAWSSTNAGPSLYETEPTWQKTLGITTPHGTKAVSDVAFVADPNTGVAVYDSYGYNRTAGWFELGGTSLGAPAWSAIIALGDQVKRLSNVESLLYQLAGNNAYLSPQPNYYDITSGTNRTYQATAGYDFLTGLGTPVANKLVPLM